MRTITFRVGSEIPGRTSNSVTSVYFDAEHEWHGIKRNGVYGPRRNASVSNPPVGTHRRGVRVGRCCNIRRTVHRTIPTALRAGIRAMPVGHRYPVPLMLSIYLPSFHSGYLRFRSHVVPCYSVYSVGCFFLAPIVGCFFLAPIVGRIHFTHDCGPPFQA